MFGGILPIESRFRRVCPAVSAFRLTKALLCDILSVEALGTPLEALKSELRGGDVSNSILDGAGGFYKLDLQCRLGCFFC